MADPGQVDRLGSPITFGHIEFEQTTLTELVLVEADVVDVDEHIGPAVIRPNEPETP